jgi:AcrR family transcriptional regulator
VPPPERGRGRPPRSFENIVSVAADLVDEFGVDGVSMRLLAERLETGTATLYRHVAGKDELMVYVLDSRMGEIVGAYDALAARPRTWREALERRIAGSSSPIPMCFRSSSVGCRSGRTH